MSTRNRAILYTVIAAILWSIAGVFIKLLSQDAFTILFYRSLFAAILFLAIFRKEVLKLNKYTVIACFIYAPLLITFVTSTKLTTAANAIFLQYTAPALVLLFEPIFLKAKLTKLNIWTVVLCMSGMCLFFVEQLVRPDNWLGIILAAIGGLLLAGLFIVQKMNTSEGQRSTIFWGNILVCLITAPWFLDAPWPNGQEMSYLAILGIGQLGLGYVFFIMGYKHLTAIESSLIGMLEPILNPVWVVFGYGEVPGLWALFGGLVIIGTLIVRMFVLKGQREVELDKIA
jgi:drug/metabolite transporter, DME family